MLGYLDAAAMEEGFKTKVQDSRFSFQISDQTLETAR